MKKTLAVVGAVALAGVLAVTAAGCATSTRNLASLSSNWYHDSGFKRIQPTFTEEAAEKLTYTVTQTEQGGNLTYSVNYAQGTYTTEFYAKKITAAELEKITLEDWREDYMRALSKDGDMYLYYYATELSLPSITFTCGDQSKEFTDCSVVTESYFLSVEDYLSPVYTVRAVNTVVPKELQVSSLEDCFYEVDMLYESYYTLSGSKVRTNVTTYSTDEQTHERKESTQVFELSDLTRYENSVFDVFYLDVVVRAMRNIGSTFSQTIGIYTPGLPVRDYTVATSDEAIFEGDKADLNFAMIEALLKDKGLFTPKPVDKNDPSKGETKLQSAAVSVSFNGENYSGVSQTYWFAVGDGNESKTLMLKYSEPITYNLGKLDYVLESISIGK